jgi:8-oxo-dGTP pyrophosphatase MutT (NUDIX family)
VTRRDYLNDPTAPQATSIVVACSAYVEDKEGKVLIIKRSDNGLYSIPGGQLEPGESLSQCAIRETEEETGIQIEITGLIGVFSNPHHVIEYDDGEVRQEFSICFRAKPMTGSVKTSNESLKVQWVPQGELKELDIHDSTRKRIEHALSDHREPYYS